MGAGHSHPPAPAGHAGGRYRRKLAIAFGLIFTFFFVEPVYGLIADSLALISDAGHMAADVVALGAALAATKIATRKDTTASGRSVPIARKSSPRASPSSSCWASRPT